MIADLFDLILLSQRYNENGRMYGRKSYSGYKEGSPVGKRVNSA